MSLTSDGTLLELIIELISKFIITLEIFKGLIESKILNQGFIK